MENNKFKWTFEGGFSGKPKDSYIKQLISYLYTLSAENKLLLEEKMKEYAVRSGILAHDQKLRTILYWLEQGHPDAWRAVADEVDYSWFSKEHPEFLEMFYKAAEKKGLAKKKWVITTL